MTYLSSNVDRKIAAANPLLAKNYRGVRITKRLLLGRPLVRQDSGTTATNFRGRQRVKRLRLRKLQRQARRTQR